MNVFIYLLRAGNQLITFWELSAHSAYVRFLCISIPEYQLSLLLACVLEWDFSSDRAVF